MGIYIMAFLAVLYIAASFMFFAKRYHRCPPDQVLVIFGKVGPGQLARCIHGGGAFVWPMVQDHKFLSLAPIQISNHEVAGRHLFPREITVAIGTDHELLDNAATRLLSLDRIQIESLAKDVVSSELRRTLATWSDEKIESRVEAFLDAFRQNVTPELNKIGLELIHVSYPETLTPSEILREAEVK